MARSRLFYEKVRPRHVITGPIEVNPDSLRREFWDYAKLRSGITPPSLVVNKITLDLHLTEDEIRSTFGYAYAKSFSGVYNSMLNKAYEAGLYFILIDGQMNALAAGLSGNRFNAYVIRSDEDLQKCADMYQRGTLAQFNLEGRTLDEIKDGIKRGLETSARKFIQRQSQASTQVFSLDFEIRRLIAEGEIPSFMVDMYREILSRRRTT